ncbi:MAG: ETC complex I subunit [Kordiimonas sp.]|nr:ETC complex I subunit [Kordiimonas sp.]|tara:strand:- start:1197 stop:1478 length:282 start_codon:yes stop_codon:yes gene_type:complete
MVATIYRPAKNVMQSGPGKSKTWVLEFSPSGDKAHDPLTGWIGSTDTKSQLQLRFGSCELAQNYAKKHGIEYRVRLPHSRKMRIKTYADNFKY